MNNLIDRAEAQTAIQSVARRYTVAHEAHGEGKVVWSDDLISVTDAMNVLREISSVQPELDSEALIRTIEMGVTATNSNDIYSLGMRNGMRWCKSLIDGVEPKFEDYVTSVDDWKKLPSAQPEKETPKRVLWSGWKGMRDTRYKCPNCKKPVRNTDIYCHRCGQKLMFPNIDFTPYVEGQKQELIVRWDDEE